MSVLSTPVNILWSLVSTWSMHDSLRTVFLVSWVTIWLKPNDKNIFKKVFEFAFCFNQSIFMSTTTTHWCKTWFASNSSSKSCIKIPNYWNLSYRSLSPKTSDNLVRKDQPSKYQNWTCFLNLSLVLSFFSQPKVLLHKLLFYGLIRKILDSRFSDKGCISSECQVLLRAKTDGDNFLFPAKISTNRLTYSLNDLTFWLKTQNFSIIMFFLNQACPWSQWQNNLNVKPYNFVFSRSFCGFLFLFRGESLLEPPLFLLPGLLLYIVLIFRKGRATSFSFSDSVFLWTGRKLTSPHFLGHKNCSWQFLVTDLIPTCLA